MDARFSRWAASGGGLAFAATAAYAWSSSANPMQTWVELLGLGAANLALGFAWWNGRSNAAWPRRGAWAGAGLALLAGTAFGAAGLMLATDFEEGAVLEGPFLGSFFLGFALHAVGWPILLIVVGGATWLRAPAHRGAATSWIVAGVLEPALVNLALGRPMSDWAGFAVQSLALAGSCAGLAFSQARAADSAFDGMR